MAQKDRIADIVNLIRVEQKVNVSNLAKRYQVTTETIRRDLELLEKEEKSEAVERYIEIIGNRVEMLKQLMSEWNGLLTTC